MSKIVKNTFIYTIGNILPKATGFILLPIYTLYLAPSDYGIISAIMALDPILVVFFSLSFNASIFRLYWDYKNEEERRVFFGTMFISTTVFSGIFLLFIFIFQNCVQKIYTSIDFNPFFLYMIITVFISNFFQLPQRYLMLKDKALHYVVLSLLYFALKAGLILWFIIGQGEGAAGYLKAGMISSFIILPAFLCITFKIIKFKFSSQVLKNILSFSLPLIPTLLCAWVLDLSDRIFLERYFTLSDVGIYSLAYKIAGIVLLLAISFNMAYRPAFFKFANYDNVQDGRNSIYRYNYIFLVAFIIGCFFIALFAQEIIVILFNPKYESAYLYVPLIAFSYFFAVAGGLVGRFFEQSKKMKENMYLALSIATLNLILNYLLIPHYGAYGAAYATVLSLLIGFIVGYNYAKKKCYFVPFNWRKILPNGIALIIIVLLFQYIIKFDNIYISLLVKSILTATIGTFFLLKYYKDIKLIFQR